MCEDFKLWGGENLTAIDYVITDYASEIRYL